MGAGCRWVAGRSEGERNRQRQVGGLGGRSWEGSGRSESVQVGDAWGEEEEGREGGQGTGDRGGGTECRWEGGRFEGWEGGERRGG